MKYKTIKYFDCKDMPEKVQEAFFSTFETFQKYYPNDIIIEWHEEYSKNGFKKNFPNNANNLNKVNLWLKKNGALPGELVLIKHWW